MRVLIVVPRYAGGETVNYRYVFPLGLAYISAALKQAGHEVAALNLNHLAGPVGGLVADQLPCVHAAGNCLRCSPLRNESIEKWS